MLSKLLASKLVETAFIVVALISIVFPVIIVELKVKLSELIEVASLSLDTVSFES